MTEQETARRFRETEAVWHIADLIEAAERDTWDGDLGIHGAIAARILQEFPALDRDETLRVVLEAELACLNGCCRECAFRETRDCELMRCAQYIVRAFSEIVPEADV